MANRKIIVYSTSCKLCEEAARTVRNAIAPCGCSVEVKATAPSAGQNLQAGNLGL